MLMTPGHSNELFRKKLKTPRRAVYYSKEKYVVGITEDVALQSIRDKHKLNKNDRDGKWTGYKVTRQTVI